MIIKEFIKQLYTIDDDNIGVAVTIKGKDLLISKVSLSNGDLYLTLNDTSSINKASIEQSTLDEVGKIGKKDAYNGDVFYVINGSSVESDDDVFGLELQNTPDVDKSSDEDTDTGIDDIDIGDIDIGDIDISDVGASDSDASESEEDDDESEEEDEYDYSDDAGEETFKDKLDEEIDLILKDVDNGSVVFFFINALSKADSESQIKLALTDGSKDVDLMLFESINEKKKCELHDIPGIRFKSIIAINNVHIGGGILRPIVEQLSDESNDAVSKIEKLNLSGDLGDLGQTIISYYEYNSCDVKLFLNSNYFDSFILNSTINDISKKDLEKLKLSLSIKLGVEVKKKVVDVTTHEQLKELMELVNNKYTNFKINKDHAGWIIKMAKEKLTEHGMNELFNMIKNNKINATSVDDLVDSIFGFVHAVAFEDKKVVHKVTGSISTNDDIISIVSDDFNSHSVPLPENFNVTLFDSISRGLKSDYGIDDGQYHDAISKLVNYRLSIKRMNSNDDRKAVIAMDEIHRIRNSGEKVSKERLEILDEMSKDKGKRRDYYEQIVKNGKVKYDMSFDMWVKTENEEEVDEAVVGKILTSFVISDIRQKIVSVLRMNKNESSLDKTNDDGEGDGSLHDIISYDEGSGIESQHIIASKKSDIISYSKLVSKFKRENSNSLSSTDNEVINTMLLGSSIHPLYSDELDDVLSERINCKIGDIKASRNKIASLMDKWSSTIDDDHDRMMIEATVAIGMELNDAISKYAINKWVLENENPSNVKKSSISRSQTDIEKILKSRGINPYKIPAIDVKSEYSDLLKRTMAALNDEINSVKKSIESNRNIEETNSYLINTLKVKVNKRPKSNEESKQLINEKLNSILSEAESIVNSKDTDKNKIRLLRMKIMMVNKNRELPSHGKIKVKVESDDEIKKSEIESIKKKQSAVLKKPESVSKKDIPKDVGYWVSVVKKNPIKYYSIPNSDIMEEVRNSIDGFDSLIDSVDNDEKSKLSSLVKMMKRKPKIAESSIVKNNPLYEDAVSIIKNSTHLVIMEQS